jgi:hypothetical protein
MSCNGGRSETDISESLFSILDSRIDQAISIVSAREPQRIPVLEAIRAIEYAPMQIASLSDYLLDCIATLSLELNSAKIALLKLEDANQSEASPTPGAFDGDYGQCLRLLRASRDTLASRIQKFTQQNERLQQRHRQDRARIAKNRKLLARLGGRPPNSVGTWKFPDSVDSRSRAVPTFSGAS